MKNLIPKLLGAIALLMSFTVVSANPTVGKPIVAKSISKSSYKKTLGSSGVVVFNYTATAFTDVQVSGIDEFNQPWTLNMSIPSNDSFYFDFGFPVTSIQVKITTASSIYYAFDCRDYNTYAQVYDTINYYNSPRTFYLPDTNYNELSIECYTE